eukprot:CAMPEP_0167814406 /NCGR_PEP_ID=MMETSP0112_2-20121227/2407_1 /TAXON_ID=91324 /ORGANISM="Lotharella globosa, Strain CCCM811" /LENGTH=277 /DNA_ID=CAMNT_0007713627 /DNA_START=75 /DNA_END=908 /DNA_ORIENTATION=+
MTYLSPMEASRLSCTCKLWREAANSDALWRGFCQARWARVWLPWSDRRDIPIESDNKLISWKQRYRIAERESRRVDMNIHELGRYVWQLYYYNKPDIIYHLRFKPEELEGDRGTFYLAEPSFKFTASLEPRELHDTSESADSYGPRVMIVPGVPPHYITRDPDWRWIFRNVNVVARSIHESEVPEGVRWHGLPASQTPGQPETEILSEPRDKANRNENYKEAHYRCDFADGDLTPDRKEERTLRLKILSLCQAIPKSEGMDFILPFADDAPKPEELV